MYYIIMLAVRALKVFFAPIVQYTHSKSDSKKEVHVHKLNYEHAIHCGDDS